MVVPQNLQKESERVSVSREMSIIVVGIDQKVPEKLN